MATARTDFSADPRSAGDARRFVRSALTEWQVDECEELAAMIVTELATNSIIHARTPFTVEVTLTEAEVRLAVSDRSRRAPTVKAHGPQATTGRGLRLVDSCSRTWGVDQHAEGKTVWATLAVGTAEGGGRGSSSVAVGSSRSPRADVAHRGTRRPRAAGPAAA